MICLLKEAKIIEEHNLRNWRKGKAERALKLTVKDSLAVAIPHLSKMHLNASNQKLKARAVAKCGAASSFYGASLPMLIMLVAGGILDDAEVCSEIANFCADSSSKRMKIRISMPKDVLGHGFLYIPGDGKFQRFECEHIEIVLYRKPSTCAELSSPLWMTSGYCVYAKTFYPVP